MSSSSRVSVSLSSFELVIVCGILADELNAELIINDQGIAYFPPGIEGGGHPLHFDDFAGLFSFLAHMTAVKDF